MQDDTKINLDTEQRTDGRPGEARRRGRPRAFCIEQALGKIREVFARKGYAETTLDDLCEATGLSRPSLYAAYGDKEQAYLAALKDYNSKNQAALETILSTPATLAEQLTVLYAQSAAFFCRGADQPGCMITSTAAAAAPSYPAIREVAAEARARLINRLTLAFTNAGAQSDAQTRAHMAAAVMESMSVRARFGEAEAQLSAFGADCATRLTHDLPNAKAEG